MAMMRVDVRGAAEVEAALDRVSEALDPVILLDEVSAMILSRIRTRFKNETNVEGVKWAPLRPKTIIQRVRLGFGARPILYRTGNLYKSIQLAKEGSMSRAIKTDVEYAAPLQFGDDKSNLPARSFLGVNKQDVDLATALIAKRVQDAIA